MSRDQDDEAKERERQALENQRKSLGDLVYGTLEPTATGPNGHELQREFRLKQVMLRMRLRVHAVTQAAMIEAGYNSFPKFYEKLLADYLLHNPIDDSPIPTEDKLVRDFVNKRAEKG